MANRSIEAKKIKMRRMKRTFPRSYCSHYIPVGGGTDKERMLMAGYREHARSLAFDSEYMDWLENKFQRFKGKTPARCEVEKHLRRIEDIAPAKMCFKLMENSALRARCFYNSDKTHWIIMEENFREGKIYTSMTYSTKDSIVYAWRKQKIKWVHISTTKTNRQALAPPLPVG